MGLSRGLKIGRNWQKITAILTPAPQRSDHPIVVRKKSFADASHSTDEWQRGERDAQEDIRRGRVKRFPSANALVADLRR